MTDAITTPGADDPGTTSHLLRLPRVLEMTGLGRSTLYKMIAEHTFPGPVLLSKRAVAWRHDDVHRWTTGRVPARPSVSHRQPR